MGIYIIWPITSALARSLPVAAAPLALLLERRKTTSRLLAGLQDPKQRVLLLLYSGERDRHLSPARNFEESKRRKEEEM